MPRKIRQLIQDLEKAGFINRGGKGSHRNFLHEKGVLSQSQVNLAMMQNRIRKKLSSRRLRRPNNER